MQSHRRDFLKSTLAVGAAITLPAATYGRIIGTNEKIRCAVIGVNGRGQDHISGLGQNVVAYCDCDEKILNERAAGKGVDVFLDYRKLLARKDIDVSIAVRPITNIP